MPTVATYCCLKYPWYNLTHIITHVPNYEILGYNCKNSIPDLSQKHKQQQKASIDNTAVVLSNKRCNNRGNVFNGTNATGNNIRKMNTIESVHVTLADDITEEKFMSTKQYIWGAQPFFLRTIDSSETLTYLSVIKALDVPRLIRRLIQISRPLTTLRLSYTRPSGNNTTAIASTNLIELFGCYARFSNKIKERESKKLSSPSPPSLKYDPVLVALGAIKTANGVTFSELEHITNDRLQGLVKSIGHQLKSIHLFQLPIVDDTLLKDLRGHSSALLSSVYLSSLSNVTD
ncbi:hypothetical protein BDA99DRAFT_544084 [Phascolomyces articulosus]|uniref:Uncharacterized protein n=1 Tax=Phascolomyces articulosus TaxID=60185 RepID=A0AAD5P8M6_9FUNG|nr:hypothetical protein BDA99DRAFT_544084 [Phascolomyces articulosus]